MPQKKAAPRIATLVRIMKPGEHLEGSRASQVTSHGEGVHHGYTLTEEANGVRLYKEDPDVDVVLPWHRVKAIHFNTDAPATRDEE